MWPFRSDPDAAFGNAVRKEFSPLAGLCDATLKQIEPSIFGFVTEYAILTIGAYPGHFRGICVKLRRRRDQEQLSVRDGEDIGLANIEAFATGKVSEIHTKRQRWASDEITEEVAGLANLTRSVALTYLTSPKADWLGLRAFVDARIKQSLRDSPWLKKYT